MLILGGTLTELIFMFLKVGFMIFIARGVLISRSDKPLNEKVLKYLDNDDAEGLKSMVCCIKDWQEM